MTYVYMGPDIKGVVRHNQFFTYKPVDIMEKAEKKSGLAKSLFIEAGDIVAAKKALNKTDSFLYLAYKSIEKNTKK